METAQNWINPNWVNNYRYVISYDGNNNRTELLYQVWNGSTWLNQSRYLYTYFPSGSVEMITTQSWDGSNWINSNRNSYQWNAGGFITSELYEMWNGGAWENDFKEEYTYDANNNNTIRLGLDWNGSAWVNDYQSLFTYDANNNNTEVILQTWNGTDWDNNTREEYTYTRDLPAGNIADLVATALFQTWNNVISQWENVWRYTYSYNTQSLLVNSLYENWNGTNWDYNYQTNISYDVNGNMDTATSQIWNGTMWVNNSRSIWTWLFVVGIEDDENAASSYYLFNNYPNPFNPVTTIKYSIPEAAFVNIKVYNLIGQEIAELVNEEMQKGNHKVTFSAVNLPSGAYFYRIQAGNYIETRKMMLVK
jgi:hypothetical protein